MAKTRKFLDICAGGKHLVGIETSDRRNPYRVYLKTRYSRRQIAKYGDFMSVLYFIKDFYLAGIDSMTTPEVIEWAKQTGSIF